MAADDKPEGDKLPAASQFDVLLGGGPAGTAVLAMVVMMAGQLPAQFGAVSPWPEAAAAFFAVLLAFRESRMVRRLDLSQCLITIPIVALILFVQGWAANTLVSQSTARTQADRQNATIVSLQEERTLMLERLEAYRKQVELLRKLAGVPEQTASVKRTSEAVERNAAERWQGFLGWVLPVAYAQPDSSTAKPRPLTPAERERLLRELKEAEQKLRETEQAEREREQQPGAPPQPGDAAADQGLWKRW
jgi:hypothetical protein